MRNSRLGKRPTETRFFNKRLEYSRATRWLLAPAASSVQGKNHLPYPKTWEWQSQQRGNRMQMAGIDEESWKQLTMNCKTMISVIITHGSTPFETRDSGLLHLQWANGKKPGGNFDRREKVKENEFDQRIRLCFVAPGTSPELSSEWSHASAPSSGLHSLFLHNLSRVTANHNGLTSRSCYCAHDCWPRSIFRRLSQSLHFSLRTGSTNHHCHAHPNTKHIPKSGESIRQRPW